MTPKVQVDSPVEGASVQVCGHSSLATRVEMVDVHQRAAGFPPVSKRRPYKARTLSGAEREVRQLRRQLARTCELLERYARDRRLLAMLAAKTPQFDNPLLAMEAERVRDDVLAVRRCL